MRENVRVILVLKVFLCSVDVCGVCVCVCVNVLTLLSFSLAAEKNHVLCFLLKWTILKGNTLLDVVSSAALITLWVRHFSVLFCVIHSVAIYSQLL